MRYPLLALSFLFGSNLARAQAPAANAAPAITRYKFYAGAAVAGQSYQIVSPVGAIRFLNRVGVYPVYVYFGRQLTPYLAVQVGFIQRSPADETYEISGASPTGQVYTTYSSQQQYDAAVPVALRYRITRNPAHRFHVDALLGAAVQVHHYNSLTSTVAAGQTIASAAQSDRNTNYFLTAGLAFGVAVANHLDIIGEGGINSNFETITHREIRQLTPSLNAGVRYFFGQ